MFLTVLPLEESEASGTKVVYDNFDDGTLGTYTGGDAGGMSHSGEDNPTIKFTTGSKEGDYALSINYDFSPGSWEGYYSFLNSSLIFLSQALLKNKCHSV